MLLVCKGRQDMRSYGYKIPSQRSTFHYHSSYSMEQPNPGDYSPSQWYEYLRNSEAATSDGDLSAQVFNPIFPPYATPTPRTLPDDQLPQEILREPSPAHTFDTSNSPPGSVDPNHIFDALNSPPGAIDLEYFHHDYELEARTSPPTPIAIPSPARTFLPPALGKCQLPCGWMSGTKHGGCSPEPISRALWAG